MSRKKLITLLLALTMILSLAVGASAAETTKARVPVTLTVVNTVSPISCTVPACLPVSLVDGYVVCANNAAITNTGKTGAIKVTKVDVQAGTFEIGNFDDFMASKNKNTGFTAPKIWCVLARHIMARHWNALAFVYRKVWGVFLWLKLPVMWSICAAMAF